MCAAAAVSSALLDLEQLPYRPYCSDDLGFGLKIRARDTALKKRLIQLNPPGKIAFLVFDVDRPGAAFAWEDANLPPPAWAATNPENGHAHLSYRLAAPVCTSPSSRNHPVRYLSMIERTMGERLGADRGYSGLITKNPFHPAWKVWEGPVRSYSLGDLSEYLPGIEKKKPAATAANNDLYSLGRNCELFDNLRHWAYGEISFYDNLEAWASACSSKARAAFNSFVTPLDEREVEGIAKSVGKWVWMHRNEFAGHTKEFIELQALRGRLGGRPSLGEPWKKLGISRRTWFRQQQKTV